MLNRACQHMPGLLGTENADESNALPLRVPQSREEDWQVYE
jgi:hypothetical protein